MTLPRQGFGGRALARAIDTGDLSLLPSRRDEDWRWSDLRALIREPLVKTVLEPGLGAVRVDGVFRALPAREVSIVNGAVNGLGFPARGPLVLDADGPVAWLNVVSAARGTAHAAEIEIEVPAGVKAVLLESHVGRGDYIVSLTLSLALGEGASLERVVVAADDPEAIVGVDAEVSLGVGSRFSQTTLTTGARRQRLETRVAHPGAGAAARLDGLYLLAGRAHSDQTTVVTHDGVDGVTDQLTKGVADDQGRGVFQGRIVVRPGADRTDARMGHHALILSDRAEIDAKPELEIYADDVACAHGNTVGALDEEAMFYARQRGMSETEARALLMGAFLGEVVDRIEYEPARDVARAWLAERLGVAP
jgi:Fe-S cluster assembly protein SufD